MLLFAHAKFWVQHGAEVTQSKLYTARVCLQQLEICVEQVELSRSFVPVLGWLVLNIGYKEPYSAVVRPAFSHCTNRPCFLGLLLHSQFLDLADLATVTRFTIYIIVMVIAKVHQTSATCRTLVASLPLMVQHQPPPEQLNHQPQTGLKNPMSWVP